MNKSRTAQPAPCPRCALPFACGAAGPAPCACTTVPLSAALQARLRSEFSGCLCLPCLRELALLDQPASTLPKAR